MSWLRRAVLSLLALAVVALGVVMPAQTANAVTPVARIIVWGDSMSLAWPAFLAPLVGIPVIANGVGGEDVQQTEARFNAWYTNNPDQHGNTVHLCWCGHVNNNPQHVGPDKDITTVIPALQRMAGLVPDGLFQPIGLENGPEASQGSDGYNLLINSPPYGTAMTPDLSGNAINEQMSRIFGPSYAEVRHYLVTDGLQVAGIQPTATDTANISVDVPPESLRRASSPSDPHLSNAGKQVTAERLNDLLRTDGLIPPSQGLPTITTAGSTINPSDYGQAIKFTATVVPASGTGTPTGTVQFFVNGSPKLSAFMVPPDGHVVSTSTAGLLAGQNVVQAVYSGSTTYASSSASFTQVVNGTGGTAPLATSTTITSSMNPAPKGTKVQFTAKVADASGQGGTVKPTGTVQFFLDGSLLGSPRSLNTQGAALTPLVQLTVGNHTITGLYSGNTKYEGSSSPPYSQTVTPVVAGTLATSTTITSTQAAAPSTKVQIRATVRDASGQGGTVKPTGSVQFYLDGNAFGAPYTLNTNGVAITPYVQLAQGQHTITSVYSGDTKYSPSNGGPLTLTVT